jgi:hypothetical protein
MGIIHGNPPGTKANENDALPEEHAPEFYAPLLHFLRSRCRVPGTFLNPFPGTPLKLDPSAHFLGDSVQIFNISS